MTSISGLKVTPKVNPRFGRRTWIKLWVNEWLDGTTRFEMTDAQRAFWTDIMAMAGRSRFPGIICAGVVEGKYVGYPLTKFQSLLSQPLDIEGTLQLFVRTGKISIETTHTEPVMLYKIELLNWSKFQSEYQRQKKYRTPKLQQSDLKSYTLSNTTEVEGEVEGEIEKKPKSKAFVPPTIEEVTKHCQSHPHVDPIKFWNHYEANGWMTGRTKMKNWKAAVAFWERTEYASEKSNGNVRKPAAKSKQEKNAEVFAQLRAEMSGENG